jgi:hypothetical protein
MQSPLRLISRFIHLTTTALLSGIIIINYLFQTQDYLNEHSSYKMLCAICGVALIATGIANVFIIRGKKKSTPQTKTWAKFFAYKLMLTLMLTPAIKPL